jgi:aromatic ring-opening dioxygenase LigB subunit
LPLVYACIAPHGGEIIPELARSKRIADLFQKTRRGMAELSRQMRKASPDVVIIASPHNLRLWKHIGIVFSEFSSGSINSESKKRAPVSVSAKCDVKLAREIYSRAVEASLPVVGANYGTFEGRTSDLPMDWGTLIPLHFFLGRRRDPKVVIVTPSREIEIQQNFAFGRIVREIADEKKDLRIAFVASADQAHTHRKSGLYGFHPSALVFDTLVQAAVSENNLKSLLNLDPKFLEDAKPDSICQIAMLEGCLSRSLYHSRLISYDCPTYYGMICADFIINFNPAQRTNA